MAENSLLKEIIIRAKAEGVEDSSDAVEVLRVAIDAVGASAGLSTRELAGLEKAIDKVDGASTRTTPGVRQMSNEFKAMVKEANALDVALREAAQSMVAGGDNNFLSKLAAGMTDSQAEEHTAVRKAEKLTADQVIAERNRVTREKERLAQQEAKIYNDYLEKQYAAEKRTASEKERLAQQQNKIYNDYLEKQYAAEKAAADKILAEARRVHAERQKLNAEAAKIQQRAFTDPKSFFGQANSAEQSAGLKASETSWAKAAQQRGAFLQENEKLVASSRQEELAYMRAVMQSKWAVDENSDALLKQNNAAKSSSDSIISLRYANYDLATSLLGTSAAITAVGAATLTAFASQERAFTDVARTMDFGTTPEKIEEIESALKSLSTQIPLTFNELSEIATIGNQMGIAANDLEGFTSTVARFAAITGISVESTTKAFGGFMAQTGMAPALLENLGSAIAKVGIDSNATEEQILSLMREITAGATGAGFAAQEIVALSGTLASLQIAPERARGSLTTYFKTLNKAVGKGGQDLENFAQIVGVTSAELETMVRQGRGQEIFRGFLDGLKDLDNVDTTRALDDLGLAQLRVSDTFRRLSGSLNLYDRDQKNANQSFAEAAELQRQYAFIVDTLSAKFQMLLNAVMNFAAQIGSDLAPAFAQMIDLATQGIVALTEFAATPVGEAIVKVAGHIAAAVAVWAGLRGAIALATASALAFKFVLSGLGGAGLAAGLGGLANAFRVTKTAADGTTVSVFALRAAILTLGRAVVIGAVLAYISEWIFNTGDAAIQTGQTFLWLADTIVAAASQVSGFLGVAAEVSLSGLRGSGNFLVNMGKDLNARKKQVDDFSFSVDDLAGAFDLGAGSADDFAGGIGDVGDAAASAQEEVRTLLDYAGDLAKVWNRAFDIRFSGQQTLDTITSSFIKIREEADAAAKRIRDLNNDIASLTSDINIQEYFLGIAIEYGDTKRAQAIEAELAKKRAELADKTAELQKEQDAANKSLLGNSKGAIENRKTITDLVKQYQAHIEALAASGMSQADLARETAVLKQDFINQATQLGYNRTELMRYAAAFDDVAVAIAKVPRNITVSANADPAIQAFNEYEAALNRARANANRGVPAVSMPVTGYVDKGARDALFAAWVQDMRRIHGVNLAQSPAGWADVRRKWDAGVWGQFAEGGYTGAGGKYEPAGVVHKGEYVIPKHMVNQATGLPYADALGKLVHGTPSPNSYARGGYVNPSAMTGIVDLSPRSIHAIAQAVPQYIVMDAKIVGETTSQQYTHTTSVGGN